MPNSRIREKTKRPRWWLPEAGHGYDGGRLWMAMADADVCTQENWRVSMTNFWTWLSVMNRYNTISARNFVDFYGF
jgi:hypothetical protein